jgi:lipid-A-disaccharide synthase-like uncharacterized protein
MKPDLLWLGLGFFAQGLFAARFVVQWLSSERARASVIPVSFWYLSLGGSLLLLTYAVHKRDLVFIAGQAAGSIVYIRNLHLIHQRRTQPVAG